MITQEFLSNISQTFKLSRPQSNRMAERSVNLYMYVHVCMSSCAKPCWVKFWQFGRHRALGLVTRGHLHTSLYL